MIDWANLQKQLLRMSDEYKNAKPFPHTYIDGFLKNDYCTAIADGFDKALSKKDRNGKKKHNNVARKIGTLSLDNMSLEQKYFFEEINDIPFVKFLSKLTGVKNIYPDQELNGGGLHEISRGGYLNIHTDFNIHPKYQWQRKLNLILYLNKNWESEWGGNIEFWDERVENKVSEFEPVFNRMIIFETSEISFHGHPKPLNTPEHIRRKSCAVYYYTDWSENIIPRKKTNYKLTPDQKNNRFIEYCESILVNCK